MHWRSPLRLTLLTAVVATILAGIVCWLWPAGLVLTITPVTGRSPLLALPLKAGECFTIRYYHSVENAPVWETHSVDAAGTIYIEEERYLKFGAGMGRMPGVGRMVMRGPYEVIEDMHQPTGDFVLRIGGAEVDHTLIWRGCEANLSTIAPHAAVRFDAQPVSVLDRAVWALKTPALSWTCPIE
jgi:hypothetical protein